jgi:mRNA-degrading endonuclease toxin of MazEF toxin-antitoxin module
MSFANVQGLASIPTVRLERRFGRLLAAAFGDVQAALRFALELP